MIKHKVFLFFAAAFIIFSSNNISYAIDDTCEKYSYPDYAYEFCGKDTCEKFNRKLLIFNLKLNKYVLRPLNIGWASIMPKYGMGRVENMYNNINFPVRVVSCLIQKDFKSSKTEMARFFINTTIGFAGLYDPAKNIFKIEPRDEDMSQALAHTKLKKGPYLILPIVRGNVRDLAGQLLDCPLRPCSYIPIAGSIVNTLCFINKTTGIQPIIKMVDDSYADPYQLARQYDGMERYIKNMNLDRKEVLAQTISSQNIVKINNDCNACGLNPDIKLENYNPQCPCIDAMRTAMFDSIKIDDSPWSEMSVWNRTFKKRFKTSSVNIDPKRANYRYKYILQKNKNAPLAIIYPSFGEGIDAEKSLVQAKILYDKGYSVVIQGSSFHWEFIKSMPDSFKPGLPREDAKYLRMVSAKIINDIQKKNSRNGGCNFSKKILVGTSFGAATALYAAAQDEEAMRNNDSTALGISNCISINPPIEMFYALNKLDKYTNDWKNNPDDIKLRTAILAEKVIQVSKTFSDNNDTTPTKKGFKPKSKPEHLVSCQSYGKYLPFTEDEAKLITGFVMKQKLADVVFTIEHGSRGKKCDLYQTINNMSFSDYAQKYLPEAFENSVLEKMPEHLISNQDNPYNNTEHIDSGTSLYSINNFLKTNNNYKIYHSIDDYYVSPEQLAWLKRQSGDKTVLFSNGSHLGCLYRKEFIEEFEKDVALDGAIQEKTPIAQAPAP